MLTYLAPVSFDSNASCPRFDRFLLEIMDDNAEMVQFLLRLLGMCLTGDVREQILPIFWGQGANGKSTLLDTIKTVMGPYSADAAPELLIQKHNESHPTEIADLKGRRLVICSESEKRARLKVQFMKRLTGDKTLKGRYMRQDFFEFQRTHKLILVTNNCPAVDEDTEAVWRRLRMVPFNRVFAEHQRDPKLMDKLLAEQSGILNRLIQGCLSWQRNGLQYPQEVKEATEGYRKSQNPLEGFFEEYIIPNPVAKTTCEKIKELYKRWCQEHQTEPISPKEFNYQMRSHGYEQTTARDGDRVFRIWEGCELCEKV
jgi:putative DNA primase/helicase